MAVSMSSFLHFLLIPWTLAGLVSTASLTPYLAEVIPSCAQACLESFITDNFPASSCGIPPIFGCLCVSDSTSGLTIGEGSLQCLASTCESFDYSDALNVYEICAPVQNAKPNTHPTLTATISSVAFTTVSADVPQITSNPQPSTSPSISNGVSVHPTSSNTSFVADTAITTATGLPSAFVNSSSSNPALTTIAPTNAISPTVTTARGFASSTRSVAAAATSSAAPGPNPVLTRPQIAGVVVAGVGAAAIGLGLCFLIFCLRKKRQNKRHSGSSFGGDKIIGSEETTPDMSAIATRDFGHQPQPNNAFGPRRELTIVTPASSGEHGWGRYQQSMDPDDIGLAVAPLMPRPARGERSPITPGSYRTASQLLPDKPTYSLFPTTVPPGTRNSLSAPGLKPLGPPTAVQRTSNPRSTPRFPSSMDTSQAYLHPKPILRNQPSDPFIDSSSRFPPNMYPVQSSRPLPPQARRPGPQSSNISPWTLPTHIPRKPVAVHQSPSGRELRSAPIRTQQSKLPRTYPPPPPHEQRYLAASENSHRRNDPPKKKSYSKRPLTYYSSSSETSFEDADDVPDPNPKVLSPVVESPALRSPFRGRVTYPTVPISAAGSPTSRPSYRPPDRAELPDHSDFRLSQRLSERKAREIISRLPDQPQPSSDESRNSAMWKILVSPGLDRKEKNPGSPLSIRAVEKTPPRR